MMKRETEVALRTHFELFRQEIRGEVGKKIEGKEVKQMVQQKVSTSEFSREMDHIRSLINSLNRQLALLNGGGAPMSPTSGGSGGGSPAMGKNTNSALRALVK